MGRLQNARVTHHHTPTTSSQPHDAFRRTVLLPLALQMAHIGLSCGWNAIGLWRVAQGQAPLGPSASWLVLVLAVLAGGCMVVGAWRRPAWYAVASAAMVLALIRHFGEFRPCTTVQLNSSFLKPLSGQDALVEAQVLRAGKTMAFGEIDLRGASDGKSVCRSTTTYALL